MPSVNNKEQIARLASLTLIFSYAEVLLPRIIPFFRLGLGNAVLLMAFELSFPSYMVLSVIKSVASSLMAGTLFSPFFLISIAQSVLSAFVMYFLFIINRFFRRKLLSLYGISIAGSVVSALVQILLSSLYLGQGTLKLLGPMLLFNLASGIITAALAEFIQKEHSEGGVIYNSETNLKAASSTASDSEKKQGSSSARSTFFTVLFVAILLGFSAALFFIKNIFVLCAALVIAFIAQKISGRRILLIPHVSLWLYVVISSLFVPNGKVLFSVFGFSVTQGALLIGIQKALRLSAVSALSQCAASLKPKEGTLLSLTLEYYRTISDTFRNTDGNIKEKLKASVRV